MSSDLEALRALFHSTNGANWKRKDNWNTDEELSAWYGVEVNDEGRVVKIHLMENGLHGVCSIATVAGSKVWQACVFLTFRSSDN